MKVYSINGKGYDSNIFVIPGEKSTVIDTGTGMHNNKILSRISKYINLNDISQIILTHEHFDHAGGVKQLFEATNEKAIVIAHKDAADKIEKGESMFARLLGGTMPQMPVDQKLSDGENLQIGDKDFEVIYTPGHTPGCICLYNKETKTLFSGDTVFANGSFGRTDLPGGSSADLKESIKKLSKLNVERLYPGHEMIVEENGNHHIHLALKNVNYFG
ncbi:MAG: MBL fold metallo-hydrolase [Candidatus Thermoplasmatota archaeon]|nr:MBL fold metallo-hydrolase [Candidatus Thermoplasmatota archaeon]MBS3801449.1 MBL fold metallo-hydrolase [Candidatus Thermoplasmatota archaeon]